MVAIGVPAEAADESRIGLTPETVKKLVKAGAGVTVRSGAGLRSFFSDEDYKAAGAKLAKSDEEAVGDVPTQTPAEDAGNGMPRREDLS